MNLPPISEEEKSLLKSTYCIQQIISLNHIQTQIQTKTNMLIGDLQTLISNDDEQGEDQFQKISNDQKNQQAFVEFQNQKFIYFHDYRMHFQILGRFQDQYLLDISDLISFQNYLNDDVFYWIQKQQLPILHVQEQIQLNVNKILQIVAQKIKGYFQILYKTINWDIYGTSFDHQFPSQEMEYKQASKIILNNFRAFFQSFDSLQQIDFEQETLILEINTYFNVLLFCKDELLTFKRVTMMQNLIYYSNHLIADENLKIIKKILASQLCFELDDLDSNYPSPDNIIQVIQRIADAQYHNYEINNKDFSQLNYIDLNQHGGLKQNYENNQILKNQLMESIIDFDDSESGLILLKYTIAQKINQIINSFQFKQALNLFYKLNNISYQFIPSIPLQNLKVIVLQDNTILGMTILNGSIIINIRLILDQLNSNLHNKKKNEWRTLLIAFICHIWLHEYSHFIIRQYFKNWDIMTPDLKKDINKNNRTFKIINEEIIQYESGEIFEKILFGKVFKPKDFTFEYSKYILDIQNWNMVSRENFINQIAQACPDVMQDLNQSQDENIHLLSNISSGQKSQ